MNPTHDKFNDISAGAKPELRAICESLRRSIVSLHEDTVEVVWKIAGFGVGPKKMSEHYAYIAVQGSHVNLGFYYGASMSDPSGDNKRDAIEYASCNNETE
jgi:hypothetical protein